jgi:hypothetical protein
MSGPVSPLRLTIDAFGRLVLDRPGAEPVAGVVPVRCFPFSAPREWISLCDERGREITCLPRLDDLSAEARAVLEQELAMRELVPIVRRILDISPGPEPTSWHVDTDRGETRFSLPGEDHVRRLAGGAALLTDAAGVRYRVPDLGKLDAHSRRLLERYL